MDPKLTMPSLLNAKGSHDAKDHYSQVLCQQDQLVRLEASLYTDLIGTRMMTTGKILKLIQHSNSKK